MKVLWELTEGGQDGIKMINPDHIVCAGLTGEGEDRKFVIQFITRSEVQMAASAMTCFRIAWADPSMWTPGVHVLWIQESKCK